MKKKIDDKFLNDSEIKKKIIKHLDEETYEFTDHALDEMGNDSFILYDILNILRFGSHASSYDSLDRAQNWKYAIEGKSLNGKKARVIIKFQKNLLIITVFKI